MLASDGDGRAERLETSIWQIVVNCLLTSAAKATWLAVKLTKCLMHRSFFPDRSICLSNYNKWLALI